MTKKITPNFLRHLLVLIIFSQSLNFFSQNVDVTITVDWNQWSRENKVELYSPADVLLYTIQHPSGYGGGASGDTYDATLPATPLSLPVNDNNPSGSGYYVILYDSYGDGWNSGGNMSITIDGVANAYTFNGSFSTSATNSEITQTEYFAVNKALDDASFSYSNAGYCQSASDPTPTVTGETGGTFSSTSGLIINVSTGQIDVSASTLGNYVVTYTTTAPDQNSSTQNVSITDGDVATFSYAYPFATTGESDISPTTTGQSGTFSSTAGLSINSATGVIDVSASTEGTYTVSYTTNGSCPKVYTDVVTIRDAIFNDGSNSYPNNATKKYIEYIPGTMPVIISAPHGGRLTGSELSTRGCGTGEMDDNTDVLIREIQKKCFEEFGVYPYIIINNLRRNKLDPNRNKSIATCNNTSAYEYFDAYHDFIDMASMDVESKYGKGLYIDLHGQSHTIPRVEAGYNLYSSSFDEDLDNSSTNTAELARVTIKNLIDNNISGASFEDLIRGSQSFGGLLQTTGGSEYAALGHGGCSRTEGYRTVPSHIKTGTDEGSCDDTNPGSYSYFAGDYYSNIRHGSGNTATANTVVEGGGTVNGGGGTIDGIMTEVNRRVRDLGSTYSSIYGVSDTRSATIPYFSRDYAKVIEKYIDVHYNNFSSFSYATNTHSIYGLDPSPTITGISGGTFTSTSGLSINSSTGVIDVSASTQGLYTVTYTAPNVGDYYKKEYSITINAAPVTNEVLMSSGDWSVPTNWSMGRIPIPQDNISIPSGKAINLDLEDVSINDISVLGTFTIDENKSLNVDGNLTNTGTFQINSGGSLIVTGTSSGNLTYNRSLNANKWYLVGSPFANQSVTDFVQNHASLALGSGSGFNQNVALALYDNNLSSNRWDYYTVGETDGLNGNDTSDNFAIGKGYSVRITSNSEISFTGSMTTSDTSRSTAIGSGTALNLISNPYPSYISSGDLLTENSGGATKGLASQTLWVWDQTLNAGSGDYITKVTVQDYKIAPGQAFFIEAANSIGVDFKETMQSHQSTDTFLKNNNRPEIKLFITNGTNVKSTEVFYIEGTTTGFDDGYDGEIFGGVSNDFALYTNLITENVGQKLAIQSIPNSNYENMIIPIGLNATSGTEITFTLESVNLPQHLDIYLENKEEGSFTKFDQNDSEYKVTLNSDANGIGNFYLHTTSQVLSNHTETLNGVNVFTTDLNTLKVLGLQEDGISISIHSVLGKKLFFKEFSSKGNSEISLPNIPTGIYFVTLKSSQGTLSKKVILK